MSPIRITVEIDGVPTNISLASFVDIVLAEISGEIPDSAPVPSPTPEPIPTPNILIPADAPNANWYDWTQLYQVKSGDIKAVLLRVKRWVEADVPEVVEYEAEPGNADSRIVFRPGDHLLATPMKFKTLYGGNHVDCVCVKPLTQRIIRPEDDYRTRLQSEPVPNDGQMYFVMRDPLFKP